MAWQRLVEQPGDDTHTAGLAQNRYFEDEAFLRYLRYLQYWQEPQYAKFVV